MKKLLFVLLFIGMLFGLFANREKVEISVSERDPNPLPFTLEPTEALYDFLFQFPVGVGGGEYAVATDGDYIYTAAWNSTNFYKYDMDGTYLSTFTIAGAGNCRDLTFDGQYFYAAPNTTTIYQMDFTNQTLVGTITAPVAVRGIAYDAEHDGFWITNGWNPPIYRINRSGVTQVTLNTTASSFSGLGWENVSDGTPYLWAYTQPASNNILVQIDVTTGATLQTFDVSTAVTFPASGISGGMVITDLVYPDKWAFLGTAQNDIIWALELIDSAPAAAPAAPTNVTVVPDASGALSALINWTCPSTTVSGDPLTELLEMRIYRNDDLIYTDNNPIIGGPGSYLDNSVPDNGMYEYRIVGYNSHGEGSSYIESLWVGEDVPAAVTELILTTIPPELIGILNWVNPTIGLHGGVFNEPILGYHIIRNDGASFELTGIHTQWIDYTIPVPGYYSYTVQPHNSVGDGGIASSTFWPWPQLLICEDFGSGIFPPDGWSTEGENWQMFNSNNAGGLVPEAVFCWSPVTMGTQRLISPPLDTSGMTYLNFQFSHFIDPYTFPDYDLKIQTTSNGLNWHTVANIEYVENTVVNENMILQGPDIGSENLQIAWVFAGNSYTINYWYIDDILLVEHYSGVTGVVEGNVTLEGGNGNVEDVLVSCYNLFIYPDSNGDYSINLPIGERDLTASLIDYEPDIITGIIVEPGITITGIDFTLTYFGSDADDIPEPVQTGITSIHPNPFNPSTTISFNVTQSSDFATIEIYNLIGQKVKTFPVILSEVEGSVTWNGENEKSHPVASGIYFCRFRSGEVVQTRKMLLLK